MWWRCTSLSTLNMCLFVSRTFWKRRVTQNATWTRNENCSGHCTSDIQTQEMPASDTPYFFLWSDGSNAIHVLANFPSVPGKLQSKPLVGPNICALAFPHCFYVWKRKGKEKKTQWAFYMCFSYCPLIIQFESKWKRNEKLKYLGWGESFRPLDP